MLNIKYLSLALLVSGLMAGLPALAQQPAAEPVSEKLYMHTDRDTYVAGEIIWFKVFRSITGNENGMPGSMAYVELLDSGNKAVLQATVSLEGDAGGSLYIPVSMNSGGYVLRAYTNRMKNESPAFFFHKPIGIINTLKAGQGLDYRDSAVFWNAAFFPEGGSMVAGIPGTIAFKLTDTHGRGAKSAGVIVNANGDTITAFSSGTSGLGSFGLKPEAGKAYTAIITVGNTMLQQPLPSVNVNGYALQLKGVEEGKLRIHLQAKYPGGEKKQENLLLRCHNGLRKNIHSQNAVIGYTGTADWLIDTALLSEGVNHITVFNEQEKPICERLYFKKPSSSQQVSISLEKNVFERRAPVNVSIAVPGTKIPAAGLSLSVYREDALMAGKAAAIDAYWMLESELRRWVESPGYYFSDEPDVAEMTDLLMLTHGRLLNENTAATKESALVYAPEFKGHYITVKVTEASNGLPVADKEVMLSIPGSYFGLYASKSGKDGLAVFEVSEYYGPGSLLLQVRDDIEKRYTVDVVSPFLESYASGFDPAPPIINASMSDDLEWRSLGMQTANIYRGDSLARFGVPALSDTFPFYGKPDYTYDLDEYKRFTTMEEVFREYVRPVTVAARGGKLIPRVFNQTFHEAVQENVLVTIDGVPLADNTLLFSYDPLKIKRVDVVPRGYVLGPSRYNGVISLLSEDRLFDAYEITPSVVSVDYDGLQLKRTFYQPSYTTPGEKQNRIPDFRTLLYWSPAVPLNAPISFYTSDIPGKYKGVVQGLTADGEPVYQEFHFEVQQ